MFLNALRYRTSLDDQHKVWKFNKGVKEFEYLQVITGDKHELGFVADVLNYVFGAEKSVSITDAAVQLEDESGNQWTVERSGAKKKKILKNGKALSHLGTDQSLIDALLDRRGNGGGVVDSFYLRVDDSKRFVTLPQKDHNSSTWFTQQLARKSKAEVLDQLKDLSGNEELGREPAATSVVKKIEPLFYANREVLKQKRSMLAHSSSLEKIDFKLIGQLTKEVELLSNIESLAGPLLDPGKSPKNLREKLKKVEIDLEAGLKSCNIKNLPVNAEPLQWNKLANCLCKLESYESLIEASEKICLIGKERLQPIREEYLTTLKRLLSEDTKITSELESCLTTLNIQLTALKAEDEGKTKSPMQLVAKFIRPSAGAVKPDENEFEKKAKLEHSRAAVDHALAKLGELQNDAVQAEYDIEALADKLEEHHEKLVSEYGKLKAYWKKLTQQSRIPESITLTDLMQLIVKYTQLNELWHTRKMIRDELSDRKNSVLQLEELVGEWRRITKSQKTDLLSNQALLISEVKALLGYKEKKSAQLEKLKDLSEHYRAYHAIKSNLEARHMQIKAAWRQAFAESLVKEVSINEGWWPQYFQLVKSVLAWDRLSKPSRKLLPLRTTLENTTSALNIISLLKPVDDIAALVKQLGAAKPKESFLLLNSDKILSERLNKVGAGRAQMIVAKPKAPRISAEPDSIVSQPRARAVLDILNGKSANMKP